MFRRIITNKRVQQTFAAFVAAVIGVSLGSGDSQIEQIAEVIAWAVAIISGALAGRGVVVDAVKPKPTVTRETGTVPPEGKPPASIPSPRRFNRDAAPVLLLLLIPALLLSPGCSTWDPGGQTAKALNQRSQFLWDESGNFVTDVDGTQTGEFTMAQGAVVLNPDGTINTEQSGLEYYLTYKPKADAAASALDRAYQQSTLQMQMQLEYMRMLTQMIGARIGVTVNADGSYTPPPEPPPKESKLGSVTGAIIDGVTRPK